ncbi:MAG: UDP-N-acetylmuramate dehydrogenase [Spirochaetales bacterium]|nr:UDP-N-acetylmuramate dehydrogenase [Spirochaetales bacterium]
MNLHTTFKTGGNADYFAVPESYDDIAILLKFTKMHSIPVFILGGGANILVSDNGIRGLVIDMSKISNFSFKENICSAEAGFSISDLSKEAAENNLSGLDFIYGMPGSVGGAVWMNARCYDVSISDILLNINYLDENFEIRTLDGIDISNNFSYKFSPFQNSNTVILSASFKLKKDNKYNIWSNMKLHKQDRENKGHYKYPSAGSVFKNNRDFGKPTGAIIDSLGLKGYSKGDAEIASFHGNIIVNKKQARSQDIRSIITYTQNKVNEKLGLKLDPEIQFIGDWGNNEYMD